VAGNRKGREHFRGESREMLSGKTRSVEIEKLGLNRWRDSTNDIQREKEECGRGRGVKGPHLGEL